MKYPLSLGLASLLVIACSEETGSSESGASQTGTGDGSSADGDGGTATSDSGGDGDATSGDGDGTTGDGTSGDGDGDGASGDGDGTSGDGDGTSGDGDGTSGDGTSGDGDGTSGDGTTGDGDGTSGDGDGTTGDGDGTTGDGDGATGDGDGDGATDIEVVITADNAYGFGFGLSDSIYTYYGDVVNSLAGDIFNCGGGPEVYTVPAAEANNAEYLYIISWRDNAVTQGVIGRFRRVGGGGTSFGDLIHTGDANWEVCATGHEYVSPGPGPTAADISAALVECNSGATDPATTSGGWVDAVGTANGRLAVGELNDSASGDFPIVCGNMTATNYMPPEARWMWFDWDPGNTPLGPFRWPGGSANLDHQFHIFRLAADFVPMPQ